jgi:GT2 family glycosyltransferase
VEESGRRVIVLGVPVLTRYDLLDRLIESALGGSVAPDRIVVVDNGGRDFLIREDARVEVISRGRNVGVSGAWNLILERATELGADRCAISNDDVELRQLTLGEILSYEADLVRAPGFAFFVLRPSVVELVGWFDENTWPAYFEDQDFSRRCRLSGVAMIDPQGIDIGHVGSATLRSWSASQQLAFARRFQEIQSYYVRKWGGQPGQERFDRPFNGSVPSGWSERPVTVCGKIFPEPWRDAV